MQMRLFTRSSSELRYIVEPLDKNLTTLGDRVRELEQKREGAYQGLQEQLRELATTQKQLQTTTLTLGEALKSSTARGRWGELQLRRVVELAGMKEHVDFDEQLTTEEGRPDMVIYLPNGGSLPLDSKAPMAAYLEAFQIDDERQRQAKLDEHVKAMRNRIKELSRRRYTGKGEQPAPFVVMFVPNETSVAAAFERDPRLLDDALELHILIATPVTLLAMLLSVGYSWQQVQLLENAKQIADEAKTLYERLTKFTDHLAGVGTSLSSAISAYNSAVGSLEHRLLPSARRVQELGVNVPDLPELAPIDQAPRRVEATE
jgi:DNA recombination protein RmuC